MIAFSKVHLRRIWLPACLAAGIFSSALGAVLDAGGGQSSPLLRSIAPYLHKRNIDVIVGTAVNFPGSSRPRLAPLAGYHAEKTDWNTIPSEGWGSAFNNGMVGVIVAMKPARLQKKQIACERQTEADADGCEFVRKWLNADSDKRVFVAFTKSDLPYAQIVRRALEQLGYVAFVFLRPGQEEPWADAGMVGEIFAQATHRFVIDTANARGSVGIALESHLCEYYLTSKPDTKWGRLLLERKP